MSSVVALCNQALRKLGSSTITALDEGSVEANVCDQFYEQCRDGLLRTYDWAFAIELVQLPADGTAPLFGRNRSFTLPSNCLRVLDPFQEDVKSDHDWVIQGRQIYTDDSAPLDVRIIKKETDVNTMDPLFRKALVAELATEMCMDLTNSNTKFQLMERARDRAIQDAKRANAIEQVPVRPPVDTWITTRY